MCFTDPQIHWASTIESSEMVWPSINLKATIADKNRSTKIYYIPGTTVGVDEGYDAGMFDAFGNDAAAIFTRIEGSEINFAIQSLPDNDYENLIVTVGINAPAGCSVNFSAEVTNLPVNMKVYLEDRLTGKFTRLDESGSFYLIESGSAIAGSGRFYLHTTQRTLGIEEFGENNITVVPLPHLQRIRIVGAVFPNSIATVYEWNGRIVGCEMLNNGRENEIPFEPGCNGVFLVKIKTGTDLITRKICWVY